MAEYCVISMIELDRAERDILTVLQAQGRLANVDIAQQVGLSESPCLRRIRALEERSIIRGYRAELDRRALGLEVLAFIQVTLEKRDDAKRQRFLSEVGAEPHIIECHAMSGGYDYLLKIVARSMEHFSELCLRRILTFTGVTNIESQFSLDAVKENGALPIPP